MQWLIRNKERKITLNEIPVEINFSEAEYQKIKEFQEKYGIKTIKKAAKILIIKGLKDNKASESYSLEEWYHRFAGTLDWDEQKEIKKEIRKRWTL